MIGGRFENKTSFLRRNFEGRYEIKDEVRPALER
jgi:hypothetical protein